MNVQDHLLGLDRKLWSGGPDDYRELLDDECLVAFGKMAGVSDREAVAGTVSDSPRWRNVKLHVEGLLQPTEAVAILTYRASATSPKDEPYRALVSSGYIKRDGDWKLMFHQQTPLAD
jgi:hypothetical protein